MKIDVVQTGPFAVNTYIIENEGNFIVVDPGGNYDLIKSKVNGEKIEAVLLTHGHFDHIGAVKKLQQDDEAPVYLHKGDLELINNQKVMAKAYGVELENITPDVVLFDDEDINLIGLNIKVVSTPGHTEGSVCYIIEKNIFSGDTLFYSTYGRVDLPGGDMDKIKNSIANKLFALDGDYTVYPGHGEKTTLDFERKHNMILSAL